MGNSVHYIDTYTLLGIPINIAGAMLAASSALAVAPWLAETRLGPLRMSPLRPDRSRRVLRIVGPLVCAVCALAFANLWRYTTRPPIPQSYAQYLGGFCGVDEHTAKVQGIHGKLYARDEEETSNIRRSLGSTVWDGGRLWGKVVFDESGRSGTFTGASAGAAGRLLIQGYGCMGATYLIGEWEQDDGKEGRFHLQALSCGDSSTGCLDQSGPLRVVRGPEYDIVSRWWRDSP